jgi:predicted DNA binding CopG/RHH family protein
VNKPNSEFQSEDQEREFWAEQDSSEILDWKQARRAIFPNLKPTLKSISLRLPESMLDELRELANERDIPCQ